MRSIKPILLRIFPLDHKDDISFHFDAKIDFKYYRKECKKRLIIAKKKVSDAFFDEIERYRPFIELPLKEREFFLQYLIEFCKMNNIPT